MTRWMGIAIVAAGCTAGPAGDPFDPNEVASLPNWIEDELAGQEDACSSSPYWDDGQVLVATTFFAGSYAWDADDLIGNEFWVLYPDPDLAATGFTACTVVWDVLGQRGDAVGAGDYSVSISATIDEDQTDCTTNVNDETVYAGDEQFNVVYDVSEVSGGSVQVFFATSGSVVGRGEFDGGGFSWLSEKDCKAF